MQRLLLGVLVLALTSLGRVTPVAAQVPNPRADTTLDDTRLTTYAKAFAAISEARDSAHATLALAANKTDANQRELRDKLQQRIATILIENHLTAEQYARITYVISTDGERRKAFETILARVTGKPSAR